MRTFESGDGRLNFPRAGIDHVNFWAVRHIEQVFARIGQQIVPSTGAADLPMIQHLIGLLSICSRTEKAAEHQSSGSRKGERARNKTDHTHEYSMTVMGTGTARLILRAESLRHAEEGRYSPFCDGKI